MNFKSTLLHILVAIPFSLFCATSSAIECESKPIEGKVNEYSVHSADDSYLGYVALEKDGTWFAWVLDLGATNKTYATRQEAVAVVCMSNASEQEQ